MLGIISIGLGMRKNGIFLVARPLRGGRGVRAWPPRKKTVFEVLKKNLETNLWPLSSRRGGGAKAGPLKKTVFCGFPNSCKHRVHFNIC